MGFAPPPRGGFAFIAAPRRQSAREPCYYLGGGRYICRMAIYLWSPASLPYARWLFLAHELRRTVKAKFALAPKVGGFSQAVLVLRLWSSQAVRFTSLAVAPQALKAATTEPPSRRRSNTSAPCSMV